MENEFRSFERPIDEDSLDLGNAERWLLFKEDSSHSENDIYEEVYENFEQLHDPGLTTTPHNQRNFECNGRCLFPEHIFHDTDGQRGQVEEIPFASMEITPKPHSPIKGQHTSYAISPYNIQVEETSLSRKQHWSVKTTASDGFGGTSFYQPNTELTFSKENAQEASGETHSRHSKCLCASPKYFFLKTSKGNYILKGRPMESNTGLQDHNIKCTIHPILDSNPLDSNSTQSAVALNSLMPVSKHLQTENKMSECFKLKSESGKVTLGKVQPKTKSVKNIYFNAVESSQSAMAVEFTPGHDFLNTDYEDYKLKSCTFASNCPLLTLPYNLPYQERPEQVTPATSISQKELTNNILEGEGPAFERSTPKAQFISSVPYNFISSAPYNLRHPRSSLISAGAFSPSTKVSYNELADFGSKQTLESVNTTSLKCEDGQENSSQWAKPSKHLTSELPKVQAKTYYLRTRECRLQLEAQVQELEKKNKSLREYFDKLEYMRDKMYRLLQRLPHLQCDQK